MLYKVTLFDTWFQAFSLIKQRGIFLFSNSCYIHLYIIEWIAGNIFVLYSCQCDGA